MARPTSSHSQHPPVPTWGEPRAQPAAQPALRRASASGSIQALLNDDTEEPPAAREAQPALIIDHRFIHNLHAEIADRTSGFSVEQLEQVNSALMGVIWKTRGEWNRKEVAKQVSKAFNTVVADMKDVQQDFLPSSWGNNSTAAH
jgi:ATPase family AAA domain-containing protein 2